MGECIRYGIHIHGRGRYQPCSREAQFGTGSYDEPESPDWMDGEGVVADRTNELIDELIRRMRINGATTVSVRVIDEVAQQVLPVGHPDTIEDYRIRAVRYGPFEPSDVIGRFELVDVHRDAEPSGVEA